MQKITCILALTVFTLSLPAFSNEKVEESLNRFSGKYSLVESSDKNSAQSRCSNTLEIKMIDKNKIELLAELDEDYNAILPANSEIFSNIGKIKKTSKLEMAFPSPTLYKKIFKSLVTLDSEKDILIKTASEAIGKWVSSTKVTKLELDEDLLNYSLYYVNPTKELDPHADASSLDNSNKTNMGCTYKRD